MNKLSIFDTIPYLDSVSARSDEECSAAVDEQCLHGRAVLHTEDTPLLCDVPHDG